MFALICLKYSFSTQFMNENILMTKIVITKNIKLKSYPTFFPEYTIKHYKIIIIIFYAIIVCLLLL